VEDVINKKLSDLRGRSDEDSDSFSGNSDGDLPPLDRVMKNGKWVDIKK
jgi:hypothetical protein